MTDETTSATASAAAAPAAGEVLEQTNLGVVGSQSLQLVGGKLVFQLELSPKVLIDGLAAKIGGPIPAEVAQFLETALGLS